MKYYTLGEGESALRVSQCCLGTMTWGEQNTEAEAHEQLSAAIDLGVNFIDAAEVRCAESIKAPGVPRARFPAAPHRRLMYPTSRVSAYRLRACAPPAFAQLYPVPPKKDTFGSTEEIIGSWLKADPTRRAKVVLASKVCSRSSGPRLAHIVSGRTYPDGVTPPTELALSRVQILAACEGSLRRLGVDCIDLYQIHWPDRTSNIFDTRAYSRQHELVAFTPFDETVGAIGELFAAGKIKQWGVSNENAVGVCKILESCARLGVCKPVTIQNDFSVLHRKFEEDGTAEACSPLHSGVAHGVRLLAYGALAGGTLSGKYTRQPGTNELRCADKGSRHTLFPGFQPRYYSGASIDTTARLVAVAAKHGLKPAQLALLWAAGREYLGSVIIGATSIAQLRENIAVFNELEPLTKELNDEIDAACDDMFQAYYSRAGEFKKVVDA